MYLVSIAILAGLIRLRKLSRVAFIKQIKSLYKKLLNIATKIKGVIIAITYDFPITYVILGLDGANREYSILTIKY